MNRLLAVNSDVYKGAITNLDERLKATEKAASPSSATVTDLSVLEGLDAVLPDAAAGILLAIEGFDSGDILSGVEGIMDFIAGIVPLIGAAIGAAVGSAIPGAGTLAGAGIGTIAGGLIGSIFSLIAEVLGFFTPKAESVAQTVRKVLEEMDVDRVQADIRSVHRAFLHYATALNNQCVSIDAVDPKTGKSSFHPAVAAEVIRNLNLIDGISTSTFWKVIDWLANSKHQNQREWLVILDAACNAYSVLLIAIIRITSLMGSPLLTQRYQTAKDDNNVTEMNALSQLWVTARAKLVLFGASQKMDLAQLRSLTPAVQNHGTLWRIQPELAAGVIDPNVEPQGFGGSSRKMSVTVCSKDQTSPNPTYHVYLVSQPKTLVHWRIVSYESDNPRMADKRPPGNDDLGTGIEDVFAIPGTDLTKDNHAIVYELSNGGETVEGKCRDENGKQIGEAFFKADHIRPEYGRGTCVRAVHNPYAYAEDTASGFLQGVEYIVYDLRTVVVAESRANPKPEVFYVYAYTKPKAEIKPQKAPWPLRIQLDEGNIKGIAVDQDYLWIFSEKQFACATHARVLKAMSTRKESEDKSFWIKCDIIPGSGPLAYLYPCGDGTLVAAGRNSSVLYQTAYHVDLKQNKITSYAYAGDKRKSPELEWTSLNNRPVNGGLEKLPAFSWPQFEGLRETLETLAPIFNK
ncbi:MAG: hypothetical protein ACRD45_14980 [Bryobacteraceae bacterium]